LTKKLENALEKAFILQRIFRKSRTTRHIFGKFCKN